MLFRLTSLCLVGAFLVGCSSCKKNTPGVTEESLVMQTNCTDWVETKLKSLPGCYEMSYIATNERNDNAVVYCDVDNLPSTPPEMAFHIVKPGAEVDSPGGGTTLSEPVCEGFDGTVRVLIFPAPAAE